MSLHRVYRSEIFLFPPELPAPAEYCMMRIAAFGSNTQNYGSFFSSFYYISIEKTAKLWYNTQYRGQRRPPAACPLPCWGAKMNYERPTTKKLDKRQNAICHNYPVCPFNQLTNHQLTIYVKQTQFEKYSNERK